MKEQEYQELALEILDMLAVAFHFAGAKDSSIEKLLDIYIKEVEKDNHYEEEYNQQAIIALINNIKQKHPQLFI